MSPTERREMICHPAVDPSGSMRGRNKTTKLSLTRQCKLLKISRSSIYYTPVGFDQASLDLMHEIDRVFTKYPFFGSRQIAAYLPQSGFSAGRHRVRRLMNIMGLQAIHCPAGHHAVMSREGTRDRTPARSIRSTAFIHIPADKATFKPDRTRPFPDCRLGRHDHCCRCRVARKG